MIDPNYDPFSDPTVDVYDTETPNGLAWAIFDRDGERLGVRWTGSPFAIDYMQQIIGRAVGLHGIGLDERTLTAEDYVGFCQPRGSGVTIHVPWYLSDGWNPPGETVIGVID